MPDLLEEQEGWDAQEIRDARKFDGALHYLVKWTGWPSENLNVSGNGNEKRMKVKAVTLFPRGSQEGPKLFNEDALLLRNFNVPGNEAENYGQQR
jgi:hypothetical protein